jgi:hypothetical protein
MFSRVSIAPCGLCGKKVYAEHWVQLPAPIKLDAGHRCSDGPSERETPNAREETDEEWFCTQCKEIIPKSQISLCVVVLMHRRDGRWCGHIEPRMKPT